MTGDGSYRLPALAPSAGGFYAWRVAVDGTATSMPVAACGAVTKVLGTSHDNGEWQSRPTRRWTTKSRSRSTVAGMPFPAQADATVALFGPISVASHRRAATNLVERRPWRVQGNGTFPSPTIQVPAPGTYAWQTSIAPGDLWLGSESPCLAPGSTMIVP